MQYFIKRDLSEYGPYTLADLQRYIAQGNILMTDLARSEAMADWVPVSQVIGNIPLPVQLAPMPLAYGAAPAPAVQTLPNTNPPNLHWGLLILLYVVTLGIFGIIWMFVEAVWLNRIKPGSKAILFLLLTVATFLGSGIVDATADIAGIVPLLELTGVALFQVANFRMRSAIEEYYNTTEPIHLDLSGILTFFFSFIYFQYHFNRINRWKRTGILDPQS